MTKFPKVWKCGCTAPRKGRIYPCGTHNHGSSRILIDRLRRMAAEKPQSIWVQNVN